MTSHSPASSPELPKLPEAGSYHDISGRQVPCAYNAADMQAYGRVCYEAGSAAAAQAAWRPIAEAPEGVRVLLGPRDAPVVGMVSHPVEWQEGERMCVVVHYNGTVLIAGYHCKEWHPLPAAPTGDQA